MKPLGQGLGDGGFVRPRQNSTQHPGADVRRMQLQGALAAGGNAQAKFVLWDTASSSYLQVGTAITVYSYKNATGNTGDQLDFIYKPDSERWEAVESNGGGAWVGVLAGNLAYHGSATVNLYTFDSGLGYFTNSGQTDTCYGWLLLSGDSIPSGTQVVGCFVDGKRVVFDAACSTGT